MLSNSEEYRISPTDYLLQSNNLEDYCKTLDFFYYAFVHNEVTGELSHEERVLAFECKESLKRFFEELKA